MAQSTKLQPSFEDVFNILSQVPPDKLLSLKHKLNHLRSGPSSKLLQAMVFLTLGQETDARICLDALRDNPAAQYVQQAKLGPAALQKDREDSQPPQLDAGAVAQLAKVYEVLAQEKLCSPEAWDNACQAATKACKNTEQGTLNNIPPQDQDKHGFATSMGPSDRFQTLRSEGDAGFLRTGGSSYVVRSSPVQIPGNSELSAPQSLCSTANPSLSEISLEISASPTVVFHTQPSPPEHVPHPSGAGHPNGDSQRHSPQESSWVSGSSCHAGQDTGAQVPCPEEVVQGSSCHPKLPSLGTPLASEGGVIQPVQSSDVPSTVTEPPAPRENTDEKQDEKELPTALPDPRAAVGTDPAHISIEDSYVPAGIPCNPTAASISTSSLPPPPTKSFSSTLPPLQESHSNLYPPPLHSSPSPARPPPPPAVDPVSLSEPDGAKFFTFVVLHASEDEIVAHRVKNLLERLGVSNGATLCEDFSVAGRSHMTCFQEAMENSAFMILLLTKNFPCNMCLFQTDTALMQSILDPSKLHSVIPFLPRENALEHSQMPKILSGLVTLNESSLVFPKTVYNTFNPKKISQKKAMWEEMQRKKLLQCWEGYQAQHGLAALSLGSSPQVPPAATQARPPGHFPQPWCPPPLTVPPSAVHPPPAHTAPPFSQPLLPPGHYNHNMPGGIPHLVIQNARMVQIGNHNTMQVETVPPGPRDSQEPTHG